MLFPKRLSRRGAEFIAGFEGFRSLPYNDPAGHATIGFGHLLHRGPVTAYDREVWGTLSRAQALELLERDAQIAADAVARLVRPRIVRQARFDALVSFVFNCGVGAFEQSTLLRRLNSGPRRVGAARELLRWNRAGGQILTGLDTRRRAEKRLFETGDYGDRAV